MQTKLCDYVEALYQAENFDTAFDAFQNEVFNLGFDGVLYTYIPTPVINSNFSVKPVFHVSEGFAPEFRSHYVDAGFDQFDPLIKALVDGVQDPIDWWGQVCESYKQQDDNSRKVIDESRSYGIQNGMTIPLMSDARGIAGASFISNEDKIFNRLRTEQYPLVEIRTRLFHNLVIANRGYRDKFVRPLLNTFNTTQRRYVTGLISGRKTSEIAAELGTSPGYLDQSMIKLRRKLSGVDDFASPTITRNQVMYYAGLMNILDFELTGPDSRVIPGSENQSKGL